MYSRQTSANESSRLDFANGIRSLMRQDPDIILVGEIRDHDTASMAFRAAMTGHQVFSTLHTNSAIGVVPRLLDIGVQTDIMAGNIIGVIAQRLVRKLCTSCRQSAELGDLERKLLALTNERVSNIFQAKGCDDCDHQGYSGRAALMEILPFDPYIDELIAKRATQRELLKLAISKGFKPLAEIGTERVLDGTTSLEEMSRVIDLSSRLRQ